MPFAVIRTGGKQYIVEKGDVLNVEKLLDKEGSSVSFETLLVSSGKTTDVGTPTLSKNVTGKVLENGKAKKVTIRTYKAKKRQQRTYGHRQPYTKVEITSLDGKATKATPKKKPAAKKPAAKAKKAAPKKK